MTTKSKPAKPAPSPFLTLDEVAHLLRVDVRTVRQWVADRQLPAIRPGKAYLVHRDQLEQFLGAKHTAASGPAR